MLKKIDCTIRTLLSMVVVLYQKILSPDHSFWAKMLFSNGYCRYYPSCSNYTKDVLSVYSLPQALLIISKRLVSCNPWSKGGFDYLPKIKT